MRTNTHIGIRAVPWVGRLNAIAGQHREGGKFFYGLEIGFKLELLDLHPYQVAQRRGNYPAILARAGNEWDERDNPYGVFALVNDDPGGLVAALVVLGGLRFPELPCCRTIAQNLAGHDVAFAVRQDFVDRLAIDDAH